MWPASKVYPKELLPLGRLPAIGYLVWELSEAGIRHITIVGTETNLPDLKAFFEPATPPAKVADEPLVVAYLRALSNVFLTFTIQKGPYGNGTPLLSAMDQVKGTNCIYLFGDDIVLGENASASLIELFQKVRCPVLASQEVPPEDASKFGIIEVKERDGVGYVTRLVEKPKPTDTPSRLASFGRYLVTPEILEHLSSARVGRDNELWFVDAVLGHMRTGGDVAVLPLKTGKWYTVGDPAGFRDAINEAVTSGADPFHRQPDPNTVLQTL
jgi:UTP--glucose-1-phosphate uridylyltransferase